MDLFAQKNSIRLAMIERRSLLSDVVVKSVALGIVDQVCALAEVSHASRIGIYAGYQKEVSTQEVFKKLRLGSREIFFPRVIVAEGKLEFVPIESEQQLVRGYLGILEPEPGLLAVKVNELDAVMVPGVAFDETGGRIGWGKGYYDKTLAGFSKTKIGLAYDFQVVESIPAAKYDQRVDIIVTENKVIRCPKN